MGPMCVLKTASWFQSPAFRRSLFLVLVCSLVKVAGSGTLVAGESFDPTRLKKETVVAGCVDPMQLEVLGDGQLLLSERAGAIRKVRFSALSVDEAIPLPKRADGLETDWPRTAAGAVRCFQLFRS